MSLKFYGLVAVAPHCSSTTFWFGTPSCMDGRLSYLALPLIGFECRGLVACCALFGMTLPWWWACSLVLWVHGTWEARQPALLQHCWCNQLAHYSCSTHKGGGSWIDMATLNWFLSCCCRFSYPCIELKLEFEPGWKENVSFQGWGCLSLEASD